jgi:hypothetical protein
MRPTGVHGIIPNLLSGIPEKTSMKKAAHMRNTSLNGTTELPNQDDWAIAH